MEILGAGGVCRGLQGESRARETRSRRRGREPPPLPRGAAPDGYKNNYQLRRSISSLSCFGNRCRSEDSQLPDVFRGGGSGETITKLSG